MLRRLIITTAAFLLAAAPAHAFRLSGLLSPVSGNPANGLADEPIEASAYDPATHCSKHSRPGVVAFTQWMTTHAKGVSWGTYRCEKWGKRSASLHAENRALDWHLDVRNAADRAEARRIIELLLAPDRNGEPQALARRMGVEEMIWDCSYWGAGMEDFKPYGPCFKPNGKPVKHMNPTVGHRDHIHFGFTKAGAAAKTSFWLSRKR